MNGIRSTLLLSLLLTTTIAAAAPATKSFRTADGAVLVGDVYAPKDKKAPTVVLLHMLGRTRQSFAPLLNGILKAGFGVINVDLRGHGQSTTTSAGTRLAYQNFTAQDWAKLPADAQTIVQDAGRLPGFNGSTVAVVGSSIGANSAALIGSNPNIKALVLLSPGADYHGLQPEKALKGLQKPLFIIAGKSDSYSADSINRWGNLGPRCKVELLNTMAHGNDLLKEPATVNRIVDFLNSQLKP